MGVVGVVVVVVVIVVVVLEDTSQEVYVRLPEN